MTVTREGGERWKTRRKHAVLSMTSELSRDPIFDRVVPVTTIFGTQKLQTATTRTMSRIYE